MTINKTLEIVLEKHTQFNDVIREFFPLQRLIIIYIDLSEEFYQVFA